MVCMQCRTRSIYFSKRIFKPTLPEADYPSKSREQDPKCPIMTQHLAERHPPCLRAPRHPDHSPSANASTIQPCQNILLHALEPQTAQVQGGGGGSNDQWKTPTSYNHVVEGWSLSNSDHTCSVLLIILVPYVLYTEFSGSCDSFKVICWRWQIAIYIELCSYV